MEARGSPGQFARRKYLHNGRSGGEEYDVPTSAGNLAPRRTKTTAGTQKELEASGSCSVAARPSAAGHGADAEEPCDVAGKSSSKNAARDLGRFPSLPPGFRASPVVPLCRVREGRQEEQSGDTRRAPRGSARSCKDSLCQRNNPAMWLWVVVVSNNESSSGSRKVERGLAWGGGRVEQGPLASDVLGKHSATPPPQPPLSDGDVTAVAVPG
ncbi:unnamed protein product [Lampetra planeri]